jgi:hypothetical protein
MEPCEISAPSCGTVRRGGLGRNKRQVPRLSLADCASAIMENREARQRYRGQQGGSMVNGVLLSITSGEASLP